MTKDIHSVLSASIDSGLVQELLKDYTELRKRHLLRDLEPTLAAAGRFCEDIMKCLVFLQEGVLPTERGIKFDDEYRRIEKYKKDSADTELLYLMIPRAARSIYTIRNKKRGQHSRGKDLLNIDLVHVVSACDWIMASLLYAAHNIPEDEAIDLMVKTVHFTPAVLIEYDGYLVPTKKGIAAIDALLVMLTSLGSEVLYSELSKQLMAHFTRGQTYGALKRAQDEKYIYRHPKTYMVVMLDEGRKRTEQIIQKYLSEHDIT